MVLSWNGYLMLSSLQKKPLWYGFILAKFRTPRGKPAVGGRKTKNKNKKYMWLNQKKKIISNHAWRKLPNMHNSNFLSIMQCTLTKFIYRHFSFRTLLQKDSEVTHQVQMLKKIKKFKIFHLIRWVATKPNWTKITFKKKPLPLTWLNSY